MLLLKGFLRLLDYKSDKEKSVLAEFEAKAFLAPAYGFKNYCDWYYYVQEHQASGGFFGLENADARNSYATFERWGISASRAANSSNGHSSPLAVADATMPEGAYTCCLFVGGKRKLQTNTEESEAYTLWTDPGGNPLQGINIEGQSGSVISVGAGGIGVIYSASRIPGNAAWRLPPVMQARVTILTARLLKRNPWARGIIRYEVSRQILKSENLTDLPSYEGPDEALKAAIAYARAGFMESCLYAAFPSPRSRR